MAKSLAAARMTDPIAHTSMLSMIGKVGAGLIAGAVIGAIVGLAASAIVGATVLTGGAAFVATLVVSGLLMHFAGPIAGKFINSVTEAAGGFLDDLFPPTIEGFINQGSANVFINNLPAARAVAEGVDNTVTCQRHPPTPPQFVAQGSDSVYINNFPAHRKTEATTCDAKTAAGSPNVFIGGNTVTMRDITSEMPWWLEKASLIIGVALAICTRDWKSIPAKLACLGLSVGLGMAVDAGISAAFGSPVHAATGAKILDGEDDTDFTLPARLPLEWTRTYNSLDPRDSPFGQGWSLPVTVQLRVNQIGEYPNIFIDDQGREIPFEAMAEGESQWNIAEGWHLGCSVGGSYLLEGADGLYREFGHADGSAPQTLTLQRIEDSNGNYLALRYDEQNRLIQLADCAGRLYVCQYDSVHTRRIISVALQQGKQSTPLVTYQYDSLGRLSGVSNSLGNQTRQFTWHDSGAGAGLMASHTLPSGMVCYYEWAKTDDPESHPRVIYHHNSEGQQWQATYTEALDGKEGTTTVIDQRGYRECWTWNSRSQITSYTNPVGETWTLEWNADGLLAACTQPNAGVWQYQYDAHGNLTTQTNPLGLSEATQWHHERPLPVSRTDALGRVWTYQYDGHDNLIQEDSPEGITQITVDEQGQPVVITDPKGGCSQWLWHKTGLLSVHIDCSNHQTRYSYDNLGNLSQITDAAGHTTEYQHDSEGQPLKLTLPDGSEQKWQWYGSGLLATTEDALNFKDQYQWNSRGQPTQHINPLGHSTQRKYDPTGNLQALINENGETYHFEYDNADRLIAQMGLGGLRTEYQLDVLGFPIEVRQAAGTNDEIVLQLKRDILGRLTSKITPETITHYRYDATDQLLQIERFTRQTDGQQGLQLDALQFTYDPAGNLTEEHSTLFQQDGKPLPAPRSTVLKHSYDPLGNRTATLLPQQRTLNYLYYGSGHLHQINLDGELISDIEQNQLYQEIQRSQGNLTSKFIRDSLGRKTSHNTQAAEQNRYWGNDNLPSNQQTNISKDFVYDANSQLIHRRDPLAGQQDYRYDALGRITQASNPNPHLQEHFSFDAASNLTETQPGRSTGFIANNRIRVFEDKRFDYDTYGRLISKRIGGHTTQQFKWNCEHQLTEVTTTCNNKTQSIRYDYDALGRRTARHDLDNTKQFIWDGMRLLQEQNLDGSITYIYEPNSYTPLARIDLAQGQEPTQDQPAQIYHFHCNINGAPEELTDAQGNIVWQARYQTLGKLLAKNGNTLTQNLRMQGQYADGDTGLYYNTFRYYDPDIGRFISEDPIGLEGGSNLYQYAPNTLGWVDPWGWDTTRTAEFRAAKEAAGIPKSQQYVTHEYVKDKQFENRTVFEFDVNGKKKYIILHENDKFGRGSHFHGADDIKGDPKKPGKYNQYPGHHPEDKKGFTKKGKAGGCI